MPQWEFLFSIVCIVYTAVVLFPLLLWGGGRGGMFYVDQYFKFKDKFYYFYLLECCKTFDVKPIDLL